MKVSVILPAAGLGTRMGRRKGRDQPKAVHAAGRRANSDSYDPKIPSIAFGHGNRGRVAAGGSDWARGLVHQEHAHQEHPAKPVRFVEGGDSRQESVENALATLRHDTELVAVHDAVRPFIDGDLVEKVIAEARADRGRDRRNCAGWTR